MSQEPNETLYWYNYENAGTLDFFYRHVPALLPYVTLYSVGLVVGLIGNVLILGGVLIDKDLRENPTCMTMLNLALADLVISCIVDGFTVAGVFVGHDFLRLNHALCSTIGSLCLIGCATSLMNMAILALNRYINIIHHEKYKKIFTARNTLFYNLLAWLLGFLIALPNLTGVNGYSFSLEAEDCVFEAHTNLAYMIFFDVSAIFVPCGLIMLCYMRIFYYVHSHKRRLSEDTVSSSTIRIAKALFASFFLFTICWLPVAVIWLVDFDGHMPMTAHLYTYLPAHLNSALNPVLYAAVNPTLRQSYLRFINKLLCRELPLQQKRRSTTSTQRQLVHKNSIKRSSIFYW